MSGPSNGIAGLDDAEAVLFGDALACNELRPAAFVPGALAPAEAQAELLRAETFLQALAVIEDSRGEDPEEHGPVALALNRIEARLELLTALVGNLLHGAHGVDPARLLRWSARGACLPVEAPVAEGSAGVLRLQPADALPQVLRLPVRAIACRGEPGALQAWLRFEALPPGLESALERHLFRIHRRAVAGQRRAR